MLAYISLKLVNDIILRYSAKETNFKDKPICVAFEL